MALTRRDAMKSAAVAAAAATAAPGEARKAHNAVPPSKPGATVEPAVRERLLLDFGWRFHLGHACDVDKDFGFGRNQHTFAKAGDDVAFAAKIDFDDHDWQAVPLPHDWAVELPFAPSRNPPATGDDPRAAHGFRPLGREYPDTSVGWYRRVFDLPASDLGRKLSLEFDGVFRDAVVMFNGYVVVRNASGYAPFRVDVTDFANYGGKNVITVRVDATLGEGWFYEGAGIYRHVWLVKTDTLHVPQWGVWVKPVLQGHTASLTIATDLVNEALAPRPCRLVSTVSDPEGRVVAVLKSPQLTIGSHETRTTLQHAMLHKPDLWSVDNPQRYHVLTQIFADGKVVDDMATAFGVRSIRFDAERGFFLNGKPVKLNGTCNHQDHAGVGAALPDSLQSWRIERLKEMGCNAYRTSHNPPTPELLDACDRLGMLVVDETRRMSSDDESMFDLARMIRRDRNHPCIIAWSIGNEEPQQGTERGGRVALTMKRLCNDLDPTRPITAAVDNPDAWGIGITPVLDVLGCNYRTDKIPAFHAREPKKCTMGTETGSTVAARGIYVRDAASGYCVAYDTEFPWWASTAEAWMSVVMPKPFIAGGFVWTGFDYRGEPTPFNQWPNVASQFGILDSCGFPKDNFFYYQAWWGKKPVLHLFPHWNWQAGQTVNVWCHSNLDSIELFLNGRSQGVRKMEPYGHVEWNVAFEPGTIEARGYKDGALMLTDKRETTGAPAQIVLTPDRSIINADGEDVAVLTVAVTDAQGRVVPTASNLVTFRASGGALIGVGNGDPRSHEPDKASQRAAFNGLCCAIIQADKIAGDIRLEAASPGLQSAVATVTAKAARLRPAVP
jgi:beta-galactosidase